MRAAQVIWADSANKTRVRRRKWSNDLLVVAVMCVIFGLQIIAVMQIIGGPAAYRMIAMEGMQ